MLARLDAAARPSSTRLLAGLRTSGERLGPGLERLQADVRGARRPSEPEAPDAAAGPAAPPSRSPEPPRAEPQAAAPPELPRRRGRRAADRAQHGARAARPREETARYLAEHFELADPDALLDDVYSRAGSGDATRPAELAELRARAGRDRRPRRGRRAAVVGPEHDDAAAAARPRAATSSRRSSGSCTTRITDPELGRAARRARAVGRPARTPTPTTRGRSLGCAATSRRRSASPTELAAELSAARSALGQQAWEEARAADDFAPLPRPRCAPPRAAPPLRRLLRRLRRTPTTSLLDDYEPGLTTAELRAAASRGCATRWSRSSPRPATPTRPRNDGVFAGPCPVERPARGGRRGRRGGRLRPGRLAARPVAAPVRAAHRPRRRAAHHALRRRRLRAWRSTRCLHEFGHGLYEAADRPALLPHDAARRGLARRPRVPEPAVGEHRRPLAAVLRAGCSPRLARRCPARPRRRSTPTRSTARSTRSSRR